jgi:hypothetical protein
MPWYAFAWGSGWGYSSPLKVQYYGKISPSLKPCLGLKPIDACPATGFLADFMQILLMMCQHASSWIWCGLNEARQGSYSCLQSSTDSADCHALIESNSCTWHSGCAKLRARNGNTIHLTHCTRQEMTAPSMGSDEGLGGCEASGALSHYSFSLTGKRAPLLNTETRGRWAKCLPVRLLCTEVQLFYSRLGVQFPNIDLDAWENRVHEGDTVLTPRGLI